MPQVVIIGSGPAGISAALYTARAGIQTTVITKGSGALQKAEKIENYYGFSTPISGTELEKSGIEGAKNVGVQFVEAEVVGLGFGETLSVETTKDSFPADRVILATGVSRAAPRIPGLTQLEGQGISYCAVCDAFFYRNLHVAILGSGDYALHEAAALLPLAASVTLLTNGAQPTVKVPDSIRVITNKIKEISGTDRVEGVQFEDGSSLSVSGIFVAYGVAGSVDLARKLGAQTEGTRIIVNENMETTVPGLYAAGDCTGGLLQVAKAVYEGAKAGTEAVQSMRKK